MPTRWPLVAQVCRPRCDMKPFIPAALRRSRSRENRLLKPLYVNGFPANVRKTWSAADGGRQSLM